MADTIIFAPQQLPFFELGYEGLYLWQSIPATVSLTPGKAYLVTWNGTKYRCVATNAIFNGVEGVGIGNLALAGIGENTGEPFLLGSALDNSFTGCYTTDVHETNTLAVYQVAEPEKAYLIWGSTLSGIADAIRAKNGATTKIAVRDMAADISAITGGSGATDVVYVTFMSHDGANALYRRAVVPGNSCVDVVSFGLLETPLRESSAASDYHFSGWSQAAGGSANAAALLQITEDRAVYAAYTASTRTYPIYFWDGDTLLATLNVAYGETPEYTPEKSGYKFTGWSPALAAVTGETNYYAQWHDMSQALAYGDCGDNASWILDSDYVLTISGTGATTDYANFSMVPWHNYQANITSVVVEEGITHLGQSAFARCSAMTSVSLPSTLLGIGATAFSSCSKLPAINIPNTVTTIGAMAFESCGLTSLVIPDSVVSIGVGGLGMQTFAACTSLTSVVIGSGVTYISSFAFNGCTKLSSVTFKNTNGWWYASSASATSGTSISSSSLANTSTAATYLKTTYLNYYWFRK